MNYRPIMTFEFGHEMEQKIVKNKNSFIPKYEMVIKRAIDYILEQIIIFGKV